MTLFNYVFKIYGFPGSSVYVRGVGSLLQSLEHVWIHVPPQSNGQTEGSTRRSIGTYAPTEAANIIGGESFSDGPSMNITC